MSISGGPAGGPMATRARLVGCEAFVRSNPKTDRFDVQRFHHLELMVGDAKSTANALCASLGFHPLAHSNMLTGNNVYASHVVSSGSCVFALTAPYGEQPIGCGSKPLPNPAFVPAAAHAQFAKHGLHVSAVGLQVGDAAHAHAQAVAGGAESLVFPYTDEHTGISCAEVRLYPGGDVALRFVSDGAVRLSELPFLPGYSAPAATADNVGFGICRVDHVVGNVPSLLAAVDRIVAMTGFHEFAEFTAADVGTVDSGLNSMVLASNNEAVLLPINEPTRGGRRKSQIATYLEQNGGPGVQHIALKTDDIFSTVAAMRAAHAAHSGFELMERPRDQYYEALEQRLGGESDGGISPATAARCRHLGVLADRDDQGVLLQIFTKPIGDRATLFIEIIQRIGCTTDPTTRAAIEQTPGCGGFGKGNFTELFRAIEEYETRAGINTIAAPPVASAECTASEPRTAFVAKRPRTPAAATDSGFASLTYLSGFRNHHASEALPGVLPIGQNSPQHPRYGLFAEQLSGSAFTCPRATNLRTWVYRLSPSVAQGRCTPAEVRRSPSTLSACFSVVDPSPRRWSPLPLVPPGERVDFVDGLMTMCGAGQPATKEGVAIHVYAFNAPMVDRAFCDADGELLVVPQLGALDVTTELGRMRVAPGEIFVVPRNLRFAVSPAPTTTTGASASAALTNCRGYVLEVFASRGFVLPDLGPIGANGLAEPRDFAYPLAWFEDRACPDGFVITTKYAGELFDARREHSPFDVVAWHGNLAPYKYDLSRFHALNSVSVDHADPSIFTVLTCPSHESGVAVADLVAFPPRWLCAEHTFRPPYFHRNVMSEFMGLISGEYDAKRGGHDGFAPGGASLHVASTPHGPDGATYAAATAADTSVPHKLSGGLAFMFETSAMLQLTPHAAASGAVQTEYAACWEGLPRARLPESAYPVGV